MSKREIERQYNKLMLDVKTKDYYTKVDLSKRVNCYVCANRHVTKTIDIDTGVTPMFITCAVCNGQATSTFYRDINPAMEPSMEWYRPSLKETLKIKSSYMLDHVLMGGLMIRKIQK